MSLAQGTLLKHGYHITENRSTDEDSRSICEYKNRYPYAIQLSNSSVELLSQLTLPNTAIRNSTQLQLTSLQVTVNNLKIEMNALQFLKVIRGNGIALNII